MRAQIQTYRGSNVYVDLEGYDRIRAASPSRINDQIDEDIASVVRKYAYLDDMDITRRIKHLEHEWDIDRSVMAFFAFAASVAVGLGLRASDKRPLYFVSLFQLPFMALHAVVGWCPPGAAFRLLGFRSRSEIDSERYALKTLRGDFHKNAA